MSDNYIDKYYDLIESVFKKCESLFLYDAIDYKLIYHLTNFIDYELNKVFSENSDWLNVKLEISDITDKYKSKFWVLQVDITGYIISGFKINNTFEIIIYINDGIIEINRIK